MSAGHSRLGETRPPLRTFEPSFASYRRGFWRSGWSDFAEDRSEGVHSPAPASSIRVAESRLRGKIPKMVRITPIAHFRAKCMLGTTGVTVLRVTVRESF